MKRTGLIIAMTVVLSAATTLGVNYLVKNSRNEPAPVVTQAASGAFETLSAPLQQVHLPDIAYPDFTYAAETGVKSVVHVKVVKRGQAQQGPQSFFDFFFGYENPNVRPRDQVGMGSGVILSKDGYIVTNNHVIEGADEVIITLEDNREFTGRLVGTDPVTDIALVKIDAKDLPLMPIGDSDALRLGQWVLAIGNPYDLRSTITAGIVSAKARSLPSYTNEFKIEAFIQTDAAVNPGNSGGALVNEKGELVGINTAIATRTGAYAGYSFAVPSNIMQKVVSDLRQFGTVQRAFLGIVMQTVTADLAKEKNLEAVKGVYIVEVNDGGAAAKAGVKVGDVLVKIDKKAVNSANEVQEQISRLSPGNKVQLTLVRNGKEEQITAVLQNQSGSTELMKEAQGEVSNFMGAQLRPASKELKDSLRIRSGVEVTSVADGKMKDAGIKSGFVITHVNQKSVNTVQEVVSAIHSSQRGALIEGKYPNGSTYYYAIGS